MSAPSAVGKADAVGETRGAAGKAGAVGETFGAADGVRHTVQTAGEYPLHFDGENSFPECARCDACCRVNVLAMTHEEVERIRAYVVEHDVHPIDRHKQRCCFEQPGGGGCMVWEARAQVCRLYNCHVPRTEVLRRNPSIHVPEDIPLVDLHECFINGNEVDPRYIEVSQG